METKLERIADKARKDTNLKFTSLTHHVTKELIYESLNHILRKSAVGIDGIDVDEAKESFENWVNDMIALIHRKGYKPPAVKRVWIPKPGKVEKRPIGIPCVADRALQRSVEAFTLHNHLLCIRRFDKCFTQQYIFTLCIRHMV